MPSDALTEVPPMRGDDTQQADIFSYISPEARIPRIIRCGRFGGWSMRCSRSCPAGLLSCTPPPATLDSTGASFAGLAAAGALHGAQRAAFDGAAGLQPAVSLVRRLEPRRSGLGRHGVSARTGTDCWKATSRKRSLPRVLEQARRHELLSDEHFTVDGTLVGGLGRAEELQEEGVRRAHRPMIPSSSPTPCSPTISSRALTGVARMGASKVFW